MSKKIGTDAILKLDNVAFDAQINGSVSVEKDLHETTEKGTNKGKTYSGDGEYTSTMDLEVYYDPAATLGAYHILEKLKAGTIGVLKFGETGAGEYYITASGYVKSESFNFNKNEMATVPATFQCTGELTTGTV